MLPMRNGRLGKDKKKIETYTRREGQVDLRSLKKDKKESFYEMDCIPGSSENCIFLCTSAWFNLTLLMRIQLEFQKFCR